MELSIHWIMRKMTFLLKNYHEPWKSKLSFNVEMKETKHTEHIYIYVSTMPAWLPNEQYWKYWSVVKPYCWLLLCGTLTCTLTLNNACRLLWFMTDNLKAGHNIDFMSKCTPFFSGQQSTAQLQSANKFTSLPLIPPLPLLRFLLCWI